MGNQNTDNQNALWNKTLASFFISSKWKNKQEVHVYTNQIRERSSSYALWYVSSTYLLQSPSSSDAVAAMQILAVCFALDSV